ncbi:MAG: hypothetical protein JXR70_12170 [Spirochaetales bacterium]|nr:hypothetical protein [Spirochaetales bacterium]
MDQELNKASAFIKRLLANPALQPFPLLQKEEQILQFLKLNANSLFPTLTSPAFFNGKNWPEIFAILYQGLLDVINQDLFQQINDQLERIDFSFVSFLKEVNYPLSKCRDQIRDFLAKLLTKYETRQAFNGPFTAVSLSITDKYIEQSFLRHEYIHFELVKVQKLKMSKEEIKNMVKASLLLMVGATTATLTTSSYQNNSVSHLIPRQYAEKISRDMQDQLKLLPPELINSAVNANLSFLENKDTEATSRITGVFAMRCKNYKHIQTVDRGADFPDKSWLNIARRNYKYYGFDIKVLDEFYKIAAENGW